MSGLGPAACWLAHKRLESWSRMAKERVGGVKKPTSTEKNEQQETITPRTTGGSCDSGSGGSGSGRITRTSTSSTSSAHSYTVSASSSLASDSLHNSIEVRGNIFELKMFLEWKIMTFSR